MPEEKKEQQRINVQVDHGGEAFYCDSITVNAGGNKFVFDFKQTTPRVDQVGDQNQTSIVIKHKAVVMDPALAKEFLRIFRESVERFENEKGEIKVQVAQKSKQKAQKGSVTAPAKTRTISTDTTTEQEIYVG